MPSGIGLNAARLVSDNVRGKNVVPTINVEALLRPFGDLIDSSIKKQEAYAQAQKDQKKADNDEINRIIEEVPVRYRYDADMQTLELRDKIAEAARDGRINDPDFRAELNQDMMKIKKYSYAAQNAANFFSEANGLIDKSTYIKKPQARAFIMQAASKGPVDFDPAKITDELYSNKDLFNFDQYLRDKIAEFPESQIGYTVDEPGAVSRMSRTYQKAFATVDPDTGKITYNIPDDVADELIRSMEPWAVNYLKSQVDDQREQYERLSQKALDGTITDEELDELKSLDLPAFESGSTKEQMRSVLKGEILKNMADKTKVLATTVKKRGDTSSGTTTKHLTKDEREQRDINRIVANWPKEIVEDPETAIPQFARNLRNNTTVSRYLFKDVKEYKLSDGTWRITYQSKAPSYRGASGESWHDGEVIIDPRDEDDVRQKIKSIYKPNAAHLLPKKESGKAKESGGVKKTKTVKIHIDGVSPTK